MTRRPCGTTTPRKRPPTRRPRGCAPYPYAPSRRACTTTARGWPCARGPPHLSLITYGPAQELVSAAARHLLAHQYEECLHAAELAGALYEFSDASDENLKEYWEIVGLAYRGLGDEREMDNAFIMARLSDSDFQRPSRPEKPEQ